MDLYKSQGLSKLQCPCRDARLVRPNTDDIALTVLRFTMIMNHASLKDYIRRWRHTRGYGVHSPLAFSIVKECIRPDKRYGFYCDAYLDFEYHEDRRGLRRARMIIRLLNLLRPSLVWMPDSDKRIATAIRMIMPKMRLSTHRECPKDADFIISFNRHDAVRSWKKMDNQEECGMLIFGKDDPIPESSTLEIESIDFRIILRRTGMQKQKYDI